MSHRPQIVLTSRNPAMGSLWVDGWNAAAIITASAPSSAV
jgi:hypothetical protein